MYSVFQIDHAMPTVPEGLSSTIGSLDIGKLPIRIQQAKKKHLSHYAEVLDSYSVFWLPDLDSNQGPAD
jgi:hypothetical protein